VAKEPTVMRVLVVEDDVSLAGAIADGLRAEGFGVDVAANGVDALWRAAEYDYDAVLLDIMLPGPSGYEVIKRIRADGIWTPVLVLTAKDGEYDEADALDLGADDYLTKPFSFVVLLAHLRALIRRGGHERPAVLACGELTLDPATRECMNSGRQIALTARESAVLEYLMRHCGQVVSKSQILTHVWDEQFHGDPNIVEVYVLRLRRKIERSPGGAALRTVRGAGYRMVGPNGA
jgi:DNA-binding response OmpR family regulator